MRLQKLILQGFKSFKDRTTIHFHEGITGIVGPNGCGKSNIVDALFWAMGEQSAKHLRGPSMRDLIFSGTDKYGPGGFAEVSLVLENSHKKNLHIAGRIFCPEEIKITRKLYRNGESDYRLNDSPCRLRDIQEVFMDTGAGAKSYSMIAQGEVDRVVGARPVDRMMMIEEVAGITKFKTRKKESLRKMQRARDNLLRLKDLSNELKKQLQATETEAKRAQRAQALQEKIRKGQLLLAAQREFDLLTKIRDQFQGLQQMRGDLAVWSSDADSLEVGLEGEKLKRDEKMAVLDALQKEQSQLAGQLRANEEKLNYLGELASDKDRQKQDRARELDLLKEELRERSSKLETLTQKLAPGPGRPSMDELGPKLQEVVSEQKRLTEKLHTLKGQQQQGADQRLKAQCELGPKAHQLEELALEIEALEAKRSVRDEQMAEKRKKLQEAQQQSQDLSQREQALGVQKQKALDEFTQAQAQHRKATQSLAHKRAQKEALERSNYQRRDSPLKKKFPSLEDLIEIPSPWARGAMAALGAVAQCLIPRDVEGLEQAWAYLQGPQAPGALVLVPSPPSPPPEELIGRVRVLFGPGAKLLSELARVPEEFHQRALPLLERVALCEDLSDVHPPSLPLDLPLLAVAQRSGHLSIQKRGQAWIVRQWAAEELSGGAIEKKKAIQALEGEVRSLTEEESSLRATEEKLAATCERLGREFAELMGQKARARARVEELSLSIGGLEGEGLEESKRAQRLQTYQRDLSQQRFDLTESLESLTEAQEDLAKQSEQVSLALEEHSQHIQQLKDHISSHKEGRALADQAQDLKSQVQKLAHRAQSLQEIIQQHEENVAGLQQEARELEVSNQCQAKDLSDQAKALAQAQEQLQQLARDIDQREEKLKGLAAQRIELEKLVVENQVKMGQMIADEGPLAQDIFEKYHVDLRGAVLQQLKSWPPEVFLEPLPPREGPAAPYTFTPLSPRAKAQEEEKLKKARTSLVAQGEINWQAAQDYERQKGRFDFLKSQEKELLCSLSDLERAIGHIDEKSKERFEVAFHEVNQKFQKVFPQVFSGGEASLRATGPLGADETGIEIFARPPGKKMQSIALMSGGEKALTALSLIFSLFLVRPSPFCFLDEVDAPLDEVNVERFNELLKGLEGRSQFVLITHNQRTMELNNVLYGITMQEPGVSKAISVELH